MSRDFQPAIRTQADLERAWQHLMGDYGHRAWSIFWMFLDAEGHPLPQLTEVEDSHEPLGAFETERFAEFLAVLAGELEPDLGPGMRIAFLRSRPGSSTLTADDRLWAEALSEAARRAALPCEVVHVSSDTGVVPVPLDALGFDRTA
jgi:hypothetical protein